MLLPAQGRQLQIHQLHMPYFLTYYRYFIDKYNVIWVFGKYLREYFQLVLTNDNKQRKKDIPIITHEKTQYYRDDLWRGAAIMLPDTPHKLRYHM
jgi:hypothetical protein